MYVKGCTPRLRLIRTFFFQHHLYLGEEYLPTVAVVAGKGSPSEDAFSKSTPWAKKQESSKKFLKSKP